MILLDVRGQAGRISVRWRAGWLLVERRETPPDSGGGQPGGCGRLAFPGTSQVFHEVAGQSKLGVGGDHQPGPSIRRLWGSEARCGPPHRLLEEPEGMFQVEATQETASTGREDGRGHVAAAVTRISEAC